jgi:phenylacetate-CoA ligase
MSRLTILSTMLQLKRLQRSQEDLLRIQNGRLKAMVRHAYAQVPYYRDLFDTARVRPEEITSPGDLHKLPVTTKKDIQGNYPARMVAAGVDVNRCLLHTTSGSTGMPMNICYGRDSFNRAIGVKQFAFLETGVHPFDRFVDLGYSEGEGRQAWFRRLGVLPLEFVSIRQPQVSMLEALRKAHPRVLYGYPSVLLLVAQELEEWRADGIRPRLVLTHGETLSDDARSRLTKAFGAEVRSTYGSVEFPRLGFECKENSAMHLFTDSHVIEFLRDGLPVAPGEEGEIVVTGLLNYEMPLIRYDLGDVGVPLENRCPCGRAFPVMGRVVGRSDDFVTMPSGRRVTPRLLVGWAWTVPGIAAFRIIQEKRDRFVFQLVKGPVFSDETVRAIRERTEPLCREEKITVDIRVVDDIPREKTGKLRTVISMVERS